MARIEKSPGLFGVGIGHRTASSIVCEWCGKRYPEVAEIDEGVLHVMFGDKEICECCFEAVERAVLAHMGNILPWFARILEHRKAAVFTSDEQLERVLGTLRAIRGAEAASPR